MTDLILAVLYSAADCRMNEAAESAAGKSWPHSAGRRLRIHLDLGSRMGCLLPFTPGTDPKLSLWEMIGDAPRSLRKDTVPASTRISAW